MNIFLCTFVGLVLFTIGCTPVSDSNQPDSCDKSCKIDSDCMQACPIGCINNNQNYELPTDIFCERIDCICVENVCGEVEPSFP